MFRRTGNHYAAVSDGSVDIANQPTVSTVGYK